MTLDSIPKFPTADDPASCGVNWVFLDLDQIRDSVEFIQKKGWIRGEMHKFESLVKLRFKKGEARVQQNASGWAENGGFFDEMGWGVVDNLKSLESTHFSQLQTTELTQKMKM